jgi:hypothetical protein
LALSLGLFITPQAFFQKAPEELSLGDTSASRHGFQADMLLDSNIGGYLLHGHKYSDSLAICKRNLQGGWRYDEKERTTLER